MLRRTAFRFILVGGTTALLYYGLLVLGVEWLGLGATTASSIGYVIAVLCNYLMHFSWTYDTSAAHTTALGRYLAMICLGFLVNGFIMYGGATWLGFHYLLVQTLAIAVIASINFVSFPLWVFRDDNAREARDHV